MKSFSCFSGNTAISRRFKHSTQFGGMLKKYSILASLALLATVLVPVTPANASLVTKSFTVSKSDGTRYSNASVALMGWDPVAQKDITSSVVQTNAQGQASIQVEASVEYYAYAVQPPTNDFSHAPFYSDGLVRDASESFTVQLKPANTKFVLQTFDGQSVPSGWVSYPATGMIGQQKSWIKILRPGAFALDLSTSISTTSRSTVEIYPDNLPGNFANTFGFTHARANNVSSYVFFPDRTSTSEISLVTVSGESVIPLRFGSPNFSGQLRSANGEQLTFSGAVVGSVGVYKANNLGQLDLSEDNIASFGEPLSVNGSFQSKLTTTAPGKYFPLFRIAGSLSVPSFVGPAFYIDGNGNYSMSESGPFTSASSFVYTVNAPSTTSGLRLQIVNPTTNQALDADVALEEISDFGNIWYGPGAVTNGLASFNLRDGSYNIWVNSRTESLAPVQLSLTVDNGEYSLRTQSGTSLTPGANGSFQLSPAIPNVTFKVVSPTNPSELLTAGVTIINSANDRFVGSEWMRNGVVVFNLPNGEYIARVEVSDSKYASRDYALTVSGNSVSLRNDSNNLVSPSGGVFTIAPYSANVVMKLVDTESSAILPGNSVWAWGHLEKRDSNSNDWQYVTTLNISNDGSLAFRASSTGEYRIDIQIQGRPDLAATTKTFTVSNISSLLDLGNVALNPSNFKFQILDPTDLAPIANASLSVAQNLEDNSTGQERYIQTGNSGLGGLAIDQAGTYTLTVHRPFEFPPSLGASQTYTLQVTAKQPSGFNFAITGVTPSGAGVFNLPLAKPNVVGSLVDKNNLPINVNVGWVDISVQKYDSQTLRWDWTRYGSSLGSDSTFGFFIDANGTYRVVFQPYGFEDASTTYSSTFEITNANRNSIAKDFGAVTFAEPTARLGVLSSSSSVRTPWSNIDVTKETNEANFYDWHESISSGRNGIANFTASSTGNYRFTVHPSWREQGDVISKTYNAVVTKENDTYKLEIRNSSNQVINPSSDGVIDLSLGTPNLRGRILTSTGSEIALEGNRWIDVNIQKYDALDDRWDWTSNQVRVKTNGSFVGFVDEPGTYRLRISPFGFTGQSLTFSTNFTITESNKATFSRNFGDIRLAPPTLSGVVVAPDDADARVANAQVVAFDNVTGEELWEYSTQTDNNGRWSMLLPAGNYSVIARAPWGSVVYGNSEPIKSVSVSSAGVATIPGKTPTSLSIALSRPTWSGTVVQPGTSTVMPFVSICMWHYEDNNSSSVCTQSNGEGRWALSKPENFTGFNESTTLTVHPYNSSTFAERRYEGTSVLTTLLGTYVSGQYYENKTLSPATPNVEITVKAGLENAANVWVNVSRPNVGWLGGAITNEQGVAKLYVANLSGELEIEAYVSGVDGLRENFTNTRKVMSSAAVAAATSGGKVTTTVQLTTPNLRVKVSKPGQSPSVPGPAVHRSWIEVYNETENRWSGSYETNALGEAALSLLAPASGTIRYRVTVNPPSLNPDLNSKTVYIATVTSENLITVTTQSGTPVVALDGKFPFVLSRPSVIGDVSSPDGSEKLRDARIVPFDISTRYELWEFGAYTNQSGEFGMALPDGSYFLVATAPWESTNLTRSERCRIDISAGALITSNSNCVNNGKVSLKLREPNVKFKLVNDGQVIPYAHVWMSVGNWQASASANRNGVVSLLIDPQEIADLNPGMSGSQDIQIWVSPPGNQSGIVQWGCSSGDSLPLCNQLPDVVIGQSYLNGVATTLQDVQFVKPNTRLTVLAQDGIAKRANSWVEVFKQESWGLRWIGGASSNFEGIAELNLENSLVNDPSARFTLYVNAPWNERTNSARGVYTDLSYAQLNQQSFKLSSPNLKVTVRQALGAGTSRWGWIGLQKKRIVQGVTYWDWYSGVGLDENGFASLSLESSSAFRLTAYPGPGSAGSQVSCEVATDANGLVSKSLTDCAAGGTISNAALEITLSAGNLQGRVFRPGGTVGLAGAIVFAEAINPADNTLVSGVTAEAVTDSTGSYGLQLSTQYNWSIKVFYVNPPGTTVPLASKTTPEIVTSSSLSGEGTTLNITLSAR